MDVEWSPGSGGPTREMFGPWKVLDDDSHLEEIAGFVREVSGRPGPPPRSVSLILVTDPATWLAGEVLAQAAAVSGQGSGSPA